ncbi:MAG: hypothetical protein MRERV_16c043 [Mycoplasmataceae bacterium RV_VA103A]|nr:MAG: hypothetical protein MRERV_16c043 [Mycoplasmataceae bacterium RV_VA103A]
MKIKVEIHRGKCRNCFSDKLGKKITAVWVMCYRLPIKGIIDGTTFEIGEHIDLCSACIAREFESK